MPNSVPRHVRYLAALALCAFALCAGAAEPKKVLVVVSSEGRDHGKTRPGFEMDELAQAWLIFRANGLTIDLASPAGGVSPRRAIRAGSPRPPRHTGPGVRPRALPADWENQNPAAAAHPNRCAARARWP